MNVSGNTTQLPNVFDSSMYDPANYAWPTGYHVISAVLLTLISTASVVGNAIVIWVFATLSRLDQGKGVPVLDQRPSISRSPANMYLVNLAVAQMLMSLVGYPFFAISSFHERWIFGQAECNWYAVSVGVTGLASISTMAAIAVDRYFVIGRNIYMNQASKRKRALILIACSWIYGGVLVLPPLFGWSSYVLEGIGTSCTFNYLSDDWESKSFILVLFFAGFCLPVCIIITSYTLTYLALRRHENMFEKPFINSGGVRIRCSGKARRRVEITIAKVAVSTVLVFCLSWLPYAIVTLLGVAGYKRLITPTVSGIPELFAKAATIYNPIIYLFRHPAFRQRLGFRVPSPKQNYSLDMKTFNKNGDIKITYTPAAGESTGSRTWRFTAETNIERSSSRDGTFLKTQCDDKMITTVQITNSTTSVVEAAV